MNVVLEIGNLNLIISLINFACPLLDSSRRGRIPIMAILAPGIIECKSLTVSRIVFVISFACLLVPSRLLVPPISTILVVLSGRPPFCMRHRMFSILSPPMPRLVHSCRWCSWTREEKQGRERRSTIESPIRQFLSTWDIHFDLWR